MNKQQEPPNGGGIGTGARKCTKHTSRSGPSHGYDKEDLRDHPTTTGQAYEAWFRRQLSLAAKKTTEKKRERCTAESKAKAETQSTGRDSATVGAQKKAPNQGNALVKQKTQQKIERKPATRAVKSGQTEIAFAKKLESKDAAVYKSTTSANVNDPNELVTKTVKAVVMGFYSFMGGKKVLRRKSQELQVGSYVDEYLRQSRFSSQARKAKVRAQLVAYGCRIDDARKGKAGNV